MNAQTKAQSISPAVYLLGAVIVFSLVPLVFNLGDAKDAPFLFAGSGNFGRAIILGVGLLLCLKLGWIKVEFTWKKFWGCLKKRHLNVFLLLAMLGLFDYVLFGLALARIDVALATVLYELWPIVAVLLFAILYAPKREKTKDRWRDRLLAFLRLSEKTNGGAGRRRRYQPLDFKTIAFIFLALIGCGLTIFSQRELESSAGFWGIFSDIISDTTLLAGVGFALLGAVAGGLTMPFTMKWGTCVAEESPTNISQDQEIFFSVLAMAVVFGLSGVLFMLIGWVPGKEFLSIEQVPFALISAIVTALGAFLFRVANIKTSNLGINAWSYAAPAFALIWLGLASLGLPWLGSVVEFNLSWFAERIDFSVPQLDLFVVGVAAIILANILANESAEVRSAYSLLMVTLWAGGALIYFLSPWEMDKEVYFQSVGVVITMYILLVAFRLDRMTTRTREEEALSLDIAGKLSEFIFVAETRLASKNEIDRKDAENDREQAKAARETLSQLDSFPDISELPHLYKQIKQNFATMRRNAVNNYSPERKDEIHAAVGQISAMESSADKFVNSKKQGHNFGEFMALFILCAVAVVILLFSVPTGLKSVGLFVTNMFAMLVSATTVFLFFNLVDLERDRKQPIMGFLKKEKSIFGVKFRSSEKRERSFERWLSITICSLLIVTYGVLLWERVLGF